MYGYLYLLFYQILQLDWEKSTEMRQGLYGGYSMQYLYTVCEDNYLYTCNTVKYS